MAYINKGCTACMDKHGWMIDGGVKMDGGTVGYMHGGTVGYMDGGTVDCRGGTFTIWHWLARTWLSSSQGWHGDGWGVDA